MSLRQMDHYAGSMFRFDFLNEPWIDLCAAYLGVIVGDAIKGATVIDYAFGRGNWSMAFKQCGARRVVAIDGSAHNCARLKEWVAAKGLTGVEIIHGDVCEAAPGPIADIVWAHGIIQHLPSPAAFVEKAKAAARSPDTLLHLYCYDRHSPRQWLVDLARRFASYGDEAAFRADAPLFSNHARLRARDDLTAPIIHWLSAAELAAIAHDAGLSVLRRNPDFGEWRRNSVEEEFQPHHFLCVNRAGLSARPAIAEPRRVHVSDLAALRIMGEQVLSASALPSEQLQKRAIGLVNTHFDALAAAGTGETVLQDFLYLLYLGLADSADVATLPEPAGSVCRLALQALHGEPRSPVDTKSAEASGLTRYLMQNTIRL
jgi:hypothetical protein